MKRKTSAVGLYCRNITTFARSGELDEEAFRRYLQRFVDAGVGVYLASIGSGESNAMTRAEISRVYQIGVEVCKGRVQVSGNPPERPTAQETLDHILLAIEGGVEIVNLYGPPGWHGFRPTEAEFLGFIDEVLREVKHPVALAPNPQVGYAPGPSTVAAICKKYPQIAAVNLVNQGDDYFIELKSMLDRDVALNVPLTGSMNTLALGASGIIGGEINLVPETYRNYLDLFLDNQVEAAGAIYADLKRLNMYVRPWARGHPRWIKMAMRAFGLPGGEGGPRSPYKMPDEDAIRTFIDGLLALNIPEINEMGRRAGLAGPS